ncbi:MAG: hypothetical protein N4J56_007999 [Chroococcidiopsis sp. SAG 2025]|nr:hypothetical protein [Chroococcidiopsis sp. SAG 2025]
MCFSWHPPILQIKGINNPDSVLERPQPLAAAGNDNLSRKLTCSQARAFIFQVATASVSV